jgi:DNA topoisomerase-1
MVEKYDKRNGSHKACINPACDYLHSGDEEEGEALEQGAPDGGE